MLKVGILGMGMMGSFHASRYFQIPNAELVALADIVPERLEATEAVTGNLKDLARPVDLSKIARYDDASRLIGESGVDIVDICLPTYLHARYTIEALDAGRHVICEKPMALTVEDANRMIDAAEKAKRLLMIAQCIRFWPEYQLLRRWVHEETYGSLLSLNLYRLGGRPGWAWEQWITDPARSGGPVLDVHIHDVDYVNYVLGPPDTIQATVRRSAVTGSYDIIHSIYGYDDGPQIHLHSGWGMARFPFVAGYEAWFETAFIRYDRRSEPQLMVFDDLDTFQPSPPEVEYEKGDGYYNEIAYFLACVENGEFPYECPPASARDSLVLVEKEIEAAETGRTLKGKE